MTGAAAEAVARAYRAVEQADRAEVWIELRPREQAEHDAAAVDAAVAAGAVLPLHGRTVAVKDNIDVAGLPTTVGLPGARRLATEDATAVARLKAAGAVVLGKTNLDQFATGLVGTRSPYGAVRGSRLPERISGGSSSGSAVAVALGMADLALGTDTAGSGRVPAALNGIVGIKPTLGTVPATGMAAACWPYDTITAFARELGEAAAAVAVMRGPDGVDPGARPSPERLRLAAPERPVLAIPDEAGLRSLTPDARREWEAAVERLAPLGELRVVDVRALLDAAKLLYDGAIVAGRYAAAGGYLEAPAGLDPTVARIVRAAGEVAGWEYVRDRRALEQARLSALELLAGCDALVTPTAPGHPTLAEVAADPVGVNAWLGTFTNFVNLLDLAAVAIPAGRLGPCGEGGDFGVTIVARPFEDQLAVDLASRFLGMPEPPLLGDQGVELAVFGAHLRGQPLNHELVAAGGRYLAEVRTSPDYRLYALDTQPAKPGLIRAASGASIAGELWRVSPGELGRLLAALPAPMTLGKVTLADGRSVVGFGCSPDAVRGARDITRYGDWRSFRAEADQRAV